MERKISDSSGGLPALNKQEIMLLNLISSNTIGRESLSIVLEGNEGLLSLLGLNMALYKICGALVNQKVAISLINCLLEYNEFTKEKCRCKFRASRDRPDSSDDSCHKRQRTHR